MLASESTGCNCRGLTQWLKKGSFRLSRQETARRFHVGRSQLR